MERIKTGISSQGAKDGKEECWAPPGRFGRFSAFAAGEELVACEQVISWLKRARGSEPVEFSDMAASSLLNHEVGTVEIPPRDTGL